MTLVIAAMMWITVSAGGTLQARDEPVSLDKIPQAVMDALRAKFPAALISACTKTREDGQVVYDIEFTQQGRKHEADITETGAYINFESAIDAKNLPGPVRSALDRRYPNASLTEVMEETEVKGKREALAAYEIVLATAAGKKIEVESSPEELMVIIGGRP